MSNVGIRTEGNSFGDFKNATFHKALHTAQKAGCYTPVNRGYTGRVVLGMGRVAGGFSYGILYYRASRGLREE